MEQDWKILENERLSKDLNAVRSTERTNLTKQVYAENQQLKDLNQLYADRSHLSEKEMMRDGKYGKSGDIFDSMFERQKHWRNVNGLLPQFYGNVMNNHQISNIGKHESSYLQREMIRDVRLTDMVDRRMTDTDRRVTDDMYRKLQASNDVYYCS